MATMTLAEMAVSVALEEARRGVFERANDNRGDRVDEYEKLAGMEGEAWCAMFVFWCYEQAAARLGVKNPMPRIFVPSVEGNTWAKTDFEHRREGVYALDNEKVAKCTFIRIV